MGVGDAFSAGFIHALRLFPDDDQRVLDYSLAAASLKNTIAGDFNLSTEEEIMDVMNAGYTIHDIKVYD
jgi:2-dehydro-3-deoxygluconokinase